MYTLSGQRLLRPSEDRRRTTQHWWENTAQQSGQTQTFLSLLFTPRRFCKFLAEARHIHRYTPLKHHWKQIWVGRVTVYTWLRPQWSRAKLSLPETRSRSQREASWHPGQCTVLYSAVLCITALYCQFVLSALTHTDTSPFNLRAEDRKRHQEGSCPAARGPIRGQPPLLPLWSKLPQLTRAASLSSKTDRWGIEVICKTIKIRLVLYIRGRLYIFTRSLVSWITPE